MSNLTRRSFTSLLSSFSATCLATIPGFAQANASQPVSAPRFSFDDVVRRARDLAALPYDSTPSQLPEAIAKLDFDLWRDVRFRPEKAFLGANGGSFRLQPFHLGHLYRRSVTINTIRDGLVTPIPYSSSLFDYGRNKFDKSMPVNLGFAGFRLHYPLNDPRVWDEVISFLGASYFRFLGRGQRYGLSARALAVNAGANGEEFPFFREFWIETPEAGSDKASLYALVDSESLAGAWRFDLYPGTVTALEVSAVVFARRPNVKIGLAPLTSMFFTNTNDRRFREDYRPEMHDSDGLLMNSGTGEWIWRPLRNPNRPAISTFSGKDIKGFGLLQRDRSFDHYQDLDLAYELRPSYWVEPREGWGEGRVELVELPTTDESNDNIVVSWVPKDPIEPGKPFNFGYKISSGLDLPQLSPGGRTVNTYQAQPRALGSAESAGANSRRFIIDFSGGELPYFSADPALIDVVPSTSRGKILRSFVVPNKHVSGFRAIIDVEVDAGQETDLRAYLKVGNRALTETWTMPWGADQ